VGMKASCATRAGWSPAEMSPDSGGSTGVDAARAARLEVHSAAQGPVRAPGAPIALAVLQAQQQTPKIAPHLDLAVLRKQLAQVLRLGPPGDVADLWQRPWAQCDARVSGTAASWHTTAAGAVWCPHAGVHTRGAAQTGHSRSCEPTVGRRQRHGACGSAQEARRQAANKIRINISRGPRTKGCAGRCGAPVQPQARARPRDCPCTALLPRPSTHSFTLMVVVLLT
jgi:hypothetical protein